MANVIYPYARQDFGAANINWVTDDIKIVLLNSTYVYDGADRYLTDLTGTVATSANLAGKTNVFGVMDASDVVLSSVAAGSTVTQVVIYQDTGTPGTSRLLVFFDRRATSVLISTATDNGDIVVIWSDGTNKIFKI